VEGSAIASKVAAVQRFDLDHVGAEIGELLGAERSRQCLGEVQDLEAFERPAGWGGSHPLALRTPAI